MAASTSVASKTYASRIPAFTNPAAKSLLETMERKKTNLCVSVDVTKKADLLKVVESVAKDVCMVKTHIDIVEDFELDLTQQLQQLSEKHDFVIFEDRKFADIGPGIITGLADVGQPLGRGLLLLAEMSSKGNLTGGDYGQKCVQAARDDTTGFTCGFIAMDRIDEKVPLPSGEPHQDFLVLTPGVGLDVKGDAKGQQYRTPDEVIRQSGCDVIIVGRGIYGALLKGGDMEEAFKSVKEQASRYRLAGWEAYLQRTSQQQTSANGKRSVSSIGPVTPPRSKRRLFAPAPASNNLPPVASSSTSPVLLDDATLARQLSEQENAAIGRRSYSLRRTTQVKTEDGEEDLSGHSASGSADAVSKKTTRRTSGRVSAAKGKAKAEEHDEVSETKTNIKEEAGSTPVKKVKPSPFDVSPQKTDRKRIKVELDASEVKPAPKRWQAQLEVLQRQRRRIIAPVDQMGCEENGRDERRADAWRVEDAEEKAKRERFTCLVSLMLSSQTKDEITAQAVKNLQANLPDGLSLKGILTASDDEISSNIAKVGFWRRKTGYIKSAAVIIDTTFGGDVPKDIDELCSLPGVGPKMAFLCLQSAWGINLGIGVDVHVHRMSNRLGWCKTTDPEQTRLVLQSWLPKELHHSINKTLVGFGQVVCVPVGPRCDLCDLGKSTPRLCPSYRKVDEKSIATRKEVTFLDEDGEEVPPSQARSNGSAAAAVQIKGPDGEGVLEAEETTADAEDEGEKIKVEKDLSW